MKENIYKQLATSGAFEAFMQLVNKIELPEVKYSHDTNNILYLIGKRDGVQEFKSELYETIKSLATR